MNNILVIHEDGTGLSLATQPDGSIIHDQFRFVVIVNWERLDDTVLEMAREDGENAAIGFTHGMVDRDVAMVLKGIMDGDPKIMQIMPTPNVSGEFATDPTIEDIFKKACDETRDAFRVFPEDYDIPGEDPIKEAISWIIMTGCLDNVYMIYADEFNRIVQETTERIALQHFGLDKYFNRDQQNPSRGAREGQAATS